MTVPSGTYEPGYSYSSRSQSDGSADVNTIISVPLLPVPLGLSLQKEARPIITYLRAWGPETCHRCPARNVIVSARSQMLRSVSFFLFFDFLMATSIFSISPCRFLDLASLNISLSFFGQSFLFGF